MTGIATNKREVARGTVSRKAFVGDKTAGLHKLASANQPTSKVANTSEPGFPIRTFVTFTKPGVYYAPPPNGVDDTNILQNAFYYAALSGLELRINQHYHITTVGITVPSNTYAVWRGDGKISLLPHNATTYEILRIHDVRDVHIEAPNLDGRRDLNAATGGEYGMGISIRGCGPGIEIDAPRTVNCWGDGAYIGASRLPLGYRYCESVIVNEHYADNNRRQGASLISAIECTFNSPQWLNTSGTNPQAGLDVEPNNANDRLDRIRINSPRTGGNVGSGIVVNLDKFAGVTRAIDIRITDHQDDGSRGGFGVGGADFGPGVSGIVRSTNPIWRNNGFAGFSAAYWPAHGDLRAEIVNPQVIDSNRLASGTARFNSPYAIYRPSDDSSGETYDIGNVHIINPRLTMSARTISRIFYIRDERAAGKVANVTITDPASLNIGASAATAIRSRIEGQVDTSDAGGVWTEDRAGSATITTQAYVFRIRCTNSSTAVFTLGTDFDVGTPVPRFEVAGSGEVQVAPPSGAAFVGQAVGAYYKSTVSGSVLSIISHGSSSFEVVGMTGSWSATSPDDDSVAVNVSPGVAALAGATLDVAATANVSVAVEPGAAVISGATLEVDVSSDEPVEVNVIAGAAELVGATATVTASDHKTVTVDPGSAEVAGATATVVASDHKSVAVVPGAAEIAGATLDVGVSADPVSPTINGSISTRASGAWGSVSNLTQAHTPASGTDKLLILVAYVANNAARTVTLTWDGVAATEILDVQQSNRPGLAAYTVNSPATGSSKNAEATFSGQVTGCAIACISIKDAGSIGLVTSTGATSGSSVTPSGTAQATGSLVVAIGNWLCTNVNQTAETYYSFPGGWSKQLERGGSDVNDHSFGIGTLPSATAGSLSCAISNSLQNLHNIGAIIEIKPA